jgi:hypothetical protein
MEKQKKSKKKKQTPRPLVWPERGLNLEHSTWLWKTWHTTMYNYCLQMRWTSKVVNTRDLVRGKTTCRGLITWCSPHMKAITVLLYRSYSMMFMIWMITFAEDNKIISSIENIITEPGFRLSGVVDRTTTYWLPLHYICLGCIHRVVSLVNKFSEKNIWIVFLLLYTL